MAETRRVEEAVQAYLLHREKIGRSDKTVEGDRSTLFQFTRFVGANQWLSRVSRGDVEDFFYTGRPDAPCRCKRLGVPCVHVPLSERLSGASFNVYLARLHSFERFCRGRGWIRTAEPWTEGIDWSKEEQRDYLRLTADQTWQLLDGAEWPRDRAVIAFALDLGPRQAEVGRVLIGDLELDEEPTGFVTIRRTKSKKYALELRRMALTPELQGELRKWLAVYAADLRVTVSDLLSHKGYYLFPAQATYAWPAPGAHYRPTQRMYRPGNAVKRALRKMEGVEDVELDGQRVGMHTLRRTAGRLFHDHVSSLGPDAGDPLRQAQILLGHSSRAVTERYLGITKDELNRDRVLSGGSFRRSPATAGNVVPLRAVEGGK